MNISSIDNTISVVEKALNWTSNVPSSEQLGFKKRLIEIRRKLKRIKFATSEPCSTAAFGESQMGKSYLVSAMLSTASKPFSVTDGDKSYDFISEINPSRPNSTIEATGVITRFSTNKDDLTPAGYLKTQLLSVTDLILILCEAFYNQVDYTGTLTTQDINDSLNAIALDNPIGGKKFLCDDDIQDIEEYLKSSSMLQKKCPHVLGSNFFDYLLTNINRLSEERLADIFNLLWNKDEYICKLWKDTLKAYKELDYKGVVYVKFDSVLKKKGTLLDVARLDEMYGQPEDQGSEYDPMAEVKITPTSEPVQVLKSFFSSLIAELCFVLPKELTESHPFLKNLDILDFPGARRPEQIKQGKLGEGKNLSTVLRRGKVSYLFNKYSAAKRISTLLFCHNNGQSAESSMGGLLDAWVNENVGNTAAKREEYMRTSNIAPLFIIGTWFNKDLEYMDDKEGDKDNLNARWVRRFNVVLEKEVLKCLEDESHWFNAWAKNSKDPFRNIYMLRDFKYSKMIYGGYDPLKGTPESGEPVRPAKYPDFFRDLKSSFINNTFVTQHFANPNESWEDAAACAKDGTLRIINSLNSIAPNVSKSRDDKFSSDFKETIDSLIKELERYYHPDSTEERLKLAKRQSGAACSQIDRMIGRDPYSFGRLLDTLMISESEVYELIHELIIGQQQEVPMSREESQIFMSAGLDAEASREDNIEALCDYLGVDNEEECTKELDNLGIELEKLLGQNKIVVGKAESIIAEIEQKWYDKVLIGRGVKTFEDNLPAISTMVSSLWTLYKMPDIGFRKMLIDKVRDYMERLDEKSSVGIISDYISIKLNEFTSTFGYNFLSENGRRKVMEKNKELRLNINEALLNETERQPGTELLTDLYNLKDVLSNDPFTTKAKDFLTRFPQYKRLWSWQQQLRIGYVYSCELPDYDVKANDALKQIIAEAKIV